MKRDGERVDGGEAARAPERFPPPGTVRPGTGATGRRLGRYEILRELGRGGMGVVYQARDGTLGRLVAIKLMSGAAASPVGEARFAREARAMAAIGHPGIVAVHEVGRERGVPYLVMDYVDGESLEAAIARARPEPRRLAELVRAAALALERAHAAGIVHRDIKPANILIDRDGRARITDFGLAREGEAKERLTATGQVIGTPHYLAPEQVECEPGAIGPWTDVYGLGAVLYEGLTGEPPFDAANILSLFRKVMKEPPPRPRALDPAVPAELEAVAMRCLEKRPERRYASARELADELERFAGGDPVLASRSAGTRSRIGTTLEWLGRRTGLSIAVGLLAASVLVAAVALAGGSRRGDGATAERAEGRAEAARARAAVASAAAEDPLGAGSAWWQPSPEQLAHARESGSPLWFEGASGVRFVLVPPGRFTMGDLRDPNAPPHEVTISRAFYVGATEVTNGQLRRFLPAHDGGAWQGKTLDDDEQPASRIDWSVAVAYCEWLGRFEASEGTFRLPTEAEWEYACRAGSKAAFPWGDALDPARANMAGDADGHAVASPVGQFPPNRWGLYDTMGNALEWCADWFGFMPELPARDPKGPLDADPGAYGRVVRGGAWHDSPFPYFAFTRAFMMPTGEGNPLLFATGFRVVATRAPPTAKRGKR